MRSSEHRIEAERILRTLERIEGQPYFEPEHGQVLATMALAHATLARVPEPTDTDNVYEPKILFQGPEAAKRVECVRLAELERTTPECGTLYTKGDARELAEVLEQEES